MINMADDNKKEEVKVKETKEEKKELKASGKISKLVDEVSSLSVLELSELVSVLQEKLGVSAMPTAVPSTGSVPTATPAAEGQAQETGGGVQTVILTQTGANKISVIKALREINQNLTLMDAKAMTETVPAEVLKEVKGEEAKIAADKLKTAGATVELK